MRIYGSSPLFNYVELVFRCKRLFIIAIILGSIITSSMVYMRKTTYMASFIAALASSNGSGAPYSGPPEGSPVIRKAERLSFWIRKDPDFMEEVVRNSGIDKRHPAEEFDKLVRMARASIGQPTIVNGVYLELGMSWISGKEAELILNALYSRFADKTVQEETAGATANSQTLKSLWAAAEKDANEKSMKRVKYLTANYWQQPAMLGMSIGARDRCEVAITDTKMLIADARAKLVQIRTALAKTKPLIVESTEVVKRSDPKLALATKRQELEGQMQLLLQRYSELHPQVVAVKREIESIDQQIKDLKDKPALSAAESSTTSTKQNPTYYQLVQFLNHYTVAEKGLGMRLGLLEKEILVQTERVRSMPQQDVIFARLDREFNMANGNRNALEQRMYLASIDEKRDKAVEVRSLKLVVKPKAEGLDSGSKTMLLYALGPILGIVVAFCFSLLAEALDHTLRTPVEVERFLGKPVLAVIPRMQAPRDVSKKLPGAAKQSITS